MKLRDAGISPRVSFPHFRDGNGQGRGVFQTREKGGN
jgi:hypothetical protein